jgi:hypothetical protein
MLLFFFPPPCIIIEMTISISCKRFMENKWLNETDLPKIMNKTSTPIIYADDTGILFADCNLIGPNKNFHIVFTTLNKWLRANRLSLNFNTTNYVRFTTKRNMTVNLKIGFSNNFMTSSCYTKFLGGWQWVILCLGITIFICLSIY